MPQPKRKQNRLTEYDYSQPGCYFITICTRNKEFLLGTVVGADVLIGPHVRLSEKGKAVETVIVRMPTVKKYIIMPNHIHVIFRIPGPGDGPMGTSAPTPAIPQLARYLKRCVTLACGENIWQRGYHDHIIRNDRDYLRIWDYIDTNPAKWREDCYYTESLEGPWNV